MLIKYFSLVSCNSENNQVLVEDLTLSTARQYAKLYLNNVWKTDDMYGKYLSILAYYEKFNDKYYVLTFEYGSINPINGTFLEESNREKIETTEFIWFHHFDVAIGRIFINNNIYTLTEAYNLNYINDDNLSNIKDLYNNHLDECKVNIRFFSYNTF